MESTKSRLVELDFIKAVAIFFMILVHCFETFTLPDLQTGNLNYTIRLLGGPFVAPIFMFSMGIGLVYSSKSIPQQLFKRGILLIIFGYLLQFFRDSSYCIVGFFKHEPSLVQKGILYILGVDIMIFAGLFFIFFVVFKLLKMKSYWLITLYIIFAVLNHFLADIHFAKLWQNIFAGYFWGSWENTWFPFFSWYIYPVCGYFTGNLIKNNENKNLFYKKMAFYSSVCLIIFYFLFQNVDFGIQSSYYENYFHQGYEGNLVYLSLILLWFSVSYFIVKCLPQSIKNIVIIWSTNLNKRYIIQWLIIGLFILIFTPLSQHFFVVVWIFFVILILSDYLSRKKFIKL
ncbi:MAG: heparan-alpha-glucosaminide N-acetyltransferase domain-containing protein [Candidatus Gastranaerophilales bacterium]|nr:heparan-alpha-glucosaminide N-acetyltransferase domain-containing protein [Candidatus Gastranaerophilales bacterium]